MRTSLPVNPATQGERIRYARISANLTQQQLADAVSKLTKGAVDKGTVSKWEGDTTSNPTNANILAIQAVTGFSVTWLVHGRGEMRVSAMRSESLNLDVLTRAIRVVAPNLAASVVVAIGAVYDLILDAPDVSDSVLARTAAAILGKPRN